MKRFQNYTFIALCICAIGIWGPSCADFTFSITFVTPDEAESTETQTATLLEGTTVQISNDIGSTRVTVDPNATQASIEIIRTALASTQADADALLAKMTVTITEPTQENNVLTINAVRPPEATDDESQFQSTISEDEINIVAIVGDAQVVNYRLRITLPSGYSVDVTQDVGQIRAVGLDAASTLTALTGSVRSIAGEADLTVSTQAGNVNIESHEGSLDVDVDAGSADIEIVSLNTDDVVEVDVDTGGIDMVLPMDINAGLRALVDLGRVSFSAGDFSSTSGVTDTRTFVEATLGSGGATIDLFTDVGNIDIDSF